MWGCFVRSVPFTGSTVRFLLVKNSIYLIRYKRRKEVHLCAMLTNKMKQTLYDIKAHTFKYVYHLLENGFYKVGTFLWGGSERTHIIFNGPLCNNHFDWELPIKCFAWLLKKHSWKRTNVTQNVEKLTLQAPVYDVAKYKPL